MLLEFPLVSPCFPFQERWFSLLRALVNLVPLVVFKKMGFVNELACFT